MTFAIFAPIFFAVAGLKVNVLNLLERRLLGFTLAAHGEACVFIVHVVAGDFVNHRPGINSRAMKQQMRIARQMVAESPELGDTQSVRIETGRPVGPSPEAVILDMAAQQDMDLIILGTALRTRFERLSLGPRVERILNNAPLLARWPLSTRLRPTLST